MFEKNENFIQQNSPDGGFLQSEEWRKFQESVGRKTHSISGEGFWANIIEHTLPVVGKYFYVPRGPVIPAKAGIQSLDKNIEAGSRVKPGMTTLLELAKKNNAGWVRIEPATDEALKLIRGSVKNKIVKAPHDVQPRELFIIDISKPEEQLLKEMKPKARYNIRLAEKKGVRTSCHPEFISGSKEMLKPACRQARQVQHDKIEAFIRLTEVMAKRQGITTHPGRYYRKMLEAMPSEMIRLYASEYQGKIIAANIVLIYGKTATYLHGASDDEYRNVMAPYLLQWLQIKDAKDAGCARYDFGGVKVNLTGGKSWAGVTRFKLGFSPDTKPVQYPGCYDIVVSPVRYWMYRWIQGIRKYL